MTFFCSRFINGYTTAIIFAVFASFFAFAGSVGPIGYRVMYPDSDPATLVGISNAASQLGNAIGGVLAGSILTATGSYTSYMVVAAGLLLICAILIVIATSQTAQNCIAKLSSKS